MNVWKLSVKLQRQPHEEAAQNIETCERSVEVVVELKRLLLERAPRERHYVMASIDLKHVATGRLLIGKHEVHV